MAKIEFYIYGFFTNFHRAEIFSQTKLPNSFNKSLIAQLKEFIIKKHLIDIDFINVSKVQDIIEYFRRIRLNYMDAYEFFMDCFKKLFFNIKDITNKLNKNFSIAFSKIKDNISNNSNGDEFIKLYKLFISKAKFEKISSK